MLRENLSNRSSGVQIPRDICTRFGRYLYSTKCSWITNICIIFWSNISKDTAFLHQGVKKCGLRKLVHYNLNRESLKYDMVRTNGFSFKG